MCVCMRVHPLSLVRSATQALHNSMTLLDACTGQRAAGQQGEARVLVAVAPHYLLFQERIMHRHVCAHVRVPRLF